MKIFVYCSQLASLIGLNKHKTWCEAIEEIWNKYDHIGYHNALKRNNARSKIRKLILKQITADHPSIQTLIESPAVATFKHSKEVAQTYLRSRKILRKTCHENIGILQKSLRSNIYTKYGDENEQNVFDYINQTIIAIEHDNLFHSKKLLTYDEEYECFLGGRVDAVSQDHSKIIEIKNRIHRLFTSKNIPIHEKIQCMGYLALLPDSYEYALLIECLTLKSGRKKVCQSKVSMDQDMWTNVLTKLSVVFAYLVSLLKDPHLQDTYIQTHRHQFSITRLIREYQEEFLSKLDLSG
jgi:hypothetical protein